MLFFVFVSLENVRPIELYLSIFTSRLVLRGKTWRHASHKACSRILRCKSGTFDLLHQRREEFRSIERIRGRNFESFVSIRNNEIAFSLAFSCQERLIQIFKKDLDLSVF